MIWILISQIIIQARCQSQDGINFTDLASLSHHWLRQMQEWNNFTKSSVLANQSTNPHSNFTKSSILVNQSTNPLSPPHKLSCTLFGTTIKHSQYKDIKLGGVPFCMHCSCMDGKIRSCHYAVKPRCLNITIPKCSGESCTFSEFLKVKSCCMDVRSINCSRNIGAKWYFNGCNYTCKRNRRDTKLTHSIIKRPWCQRISATKFCAVCPNKTKFVKKYAKSLTLCKETGEIVRWEEICDGKDHCLNGSDERNCQKYYCKTSHVTILGKKLWFGRREINSTATSKCSLIRHGLKGFFNAVCQNPQDPTKEAFWRVDYCRCRNTAKLHLNVSELQQNYRPQGTVNLTLEVLTFAKTSIYHSEYLPQSIKLMILALKISNSKIFEGGLLWNIYRNMREVWQMEAPCSDNLVHDIPGYFEEKILLKILLDEYFTKHHFPPDWKKKKVYPTEPYIRAFTGVYENMLSNKLLSKITEIPDSIDVGDIDNNSTIANDNRTLNHTSQNNGHLLSESKIVQLRKKLAHLRIQGLIETILGSVSLLACVIGFMFMSCLHGIPSSTKIFIHKNLFSAFAMAYGFQIVGRWTANYMRETKNLCMTYLLASHYFIFSTWVWMLLEGGHVLMLMVFVFQPRMKRHWVWASIGWGIPMAILLTELAIAFKDFKDNISCIGHAKDEWLFKGPAIILLSINFIIFICLLGYIFSSLKKSRKHRTAFEKSKAAMKASIVLLPLLGISYILGFASNNIIVGYLYVCINSLMGILLFVFHCLLDSQVKKVLEHAFCKERKRRRRHKENEGIKLKNRVAKGVEPNDAAVHPMSISDITLTENSSIRSLACKI